MFRLLKNVKHVQKFCCSMLVTYSIDWKIQYPSQVTRNFVHLFWEQCESGIGQSTQNINSFCITACCLIVTVPIRVLHSDRTGCSINFFHHSTTLSFTIHTVKWSKLNMQCTTHDFQQLKVENQLALLTHCSV